MMDELTSIWIGIKNIFIWMPVIYKDRQWDHYYFFKILEFKLTLMANMFEKEGHGINSHKDAKQMRICAELCKRFSEDNYSEETLKAHAEKWGDLKMDFKDDPKKSGFGSLKMYREKCITEKEKTMECIENKKIWDHEEKMKQQDINKLFDTLKKYIRGWWD